MHSRWETICLYEESMFEDVPNNTDSITKEFKSVQQAFNADELSTETAIKDFHYSMH